MNPAYCQHGVKSCPACDELIAIGVQVDKDRIAAMESRTSWMPSSTIPFTGEFLLGVWEGEWRNQKQKFRVYHAFGAKNGPFWGRSYRTEEGEAYVVAGWMPLPEPPK